MIRRPKSALPPPLPGVFDYWIMAHVTLHEPIQFEPPDEPPAVGYYQNFGVRCAPNHIKGLLEAAVGDGTLDWKGTEISERDPSDLPRDIRRRVSSVAEQGIWYTSGKAFYPAEEPVERAN